MKLAYPLFENPIAFNENAINVLVVENKGCCAGLIRELLDASNGDKSGFVLSEDNNEMSFSEVDIITDLFHFEINNRKNITRLISILAKYAVDEEHFSDTCRIRAEIEAYVESVIDSVDFNLHISDINLQDIFKICGVAFESEEPDMCSALLEYMKIYDNLLGIKLFIIVNLRQFLDNNAAEDLYKNIIYNKYNVLLIETAVPETKIAIEKYKIIDKDLCEIT